MKIADLSSGASKLQRAVKTLNARWQQAELSWHDPVSRKFEEEYLSLIEPQVMATLERLSSLSQVLNNAEQECS